jgi:hypothetical protein
MNVSAAANAEMKNASFTGNDATILIDFDAWGFTIEFPCLAWGLGLSDSLSLWGLDFSV